MSAILIRVGIKHLPPDSAKPIVDDGLLFSLPSPVPWPEPQNKPCPLPPPRPRSSSQSGGS